MKVKNKTGRFGIFRLLLTLVIATAASIAVGQITAKIAHRFSPLWASDLNKLAPLIILEVYLCIILVILFMLGRNAYQRREWLGLRPAGLRSFGFGLIVWAAGYVTAGIYYIVTSPFGSSLTKAIDVLWAVGADNGRLAEASISGMIIILLRIVVLSPVGEELLFRGVLFTWLRSHLSAKWTILITGVIFGFLHQSPAFLPLAIIVGFSAGWIREKTGSTWVPIVIHMVQNSIIVLLSYLITGWHPDPNVLFGG